ncbi:MAG: hypothetical protein GXY10_02975 [Clostridiales bacterium]|jgi:cell division ATPase FtsA|nr:hypothetical protein [Clostridiales bacterium]
MKIIKDAILNIGSDNITLAIIDGKCSNSFFYESYKAFLGFQNGNFIDEEDLFFCIKSLIKECETSVFGKISKILVGVPGEFTNVIEKEVEMSLGPTRRKIISRDADNILIKGEPIKNDSNVAINASPICYILDENERTMCPEGKYAQNIKAQISYVLCDRYFYDLFNDISNELNICFEYTSTILAETMFLMPRDARDNGAFLVDIGFISSSVAFSQGDGLVFIKSFSLGGGYIASDIMDVLDIPYDHVASLAEKININLSPASNDQYYISVNNSNFAYKISLINEIAVSTIDDICDYVQKAINSCPYKSQESSPIYLTGSGFANITGARERMAQILGKDIEIISSPIPQYNKPSFSGIASLLMLMQTKINKIGFFNKLLNNFKYIFRRK